MISARCRDGIFQATEIIKEFLVNFMSAVFRRAERPHLRTLYIGPLNFRILLIWMNYE